MKILFSFLVGGKAVIFKKRYFRGDSGVKRRE
ncbi:hypothetical protein HPPN135_06380 [Helicobacter pylori Puno135]|nr:hypothetical protein HPPN135_06380 [Helicobacter pylori Puno135]